MWHFKILSGAPIMSTPYDCLILHGRSHSAFWGGIGRSHVGAHVAFDGTAEQG